MALVWSLLIVLLQVSDLDAWRHTSIANSVSFEGTVSAEDHLNESSSASVREEAQQSFEDGNVATRATAKAARFDAILTGRVLSNADAFSGATQPSLGSVSEPKKKKKRSNDSAHGKWLKISAKILNGQKWYEIYNGDHRHLDRLQLSFVEPLQLKNAPSENFQTYGAVWHVTITRAASQAWSYGKHLVWKGVDSNEISMTLGISEIINSLGVSSLSAVEQVAFNKELDQFLIPFRDPSTMIAKTRSLGPKRFELVAAFVLFQEALLINGYADGDHDWVYPGDSSEEDDALKNVFVGRDAIWMFDFDQAVKFEYTDIAYKSPLYVDDPHLQAQLMSSYSKIISTIASHCLDALIDSGGYLEQVGLLNTFMRLRAQTNVKAALRGITNDILGLTLSAHLKGLRVVQIYLNEKKS